MNLKDELVEWTDFDIAYHKLAVQLGLFKTDNFSGFAWVYWTKNEYNDFLLNTLLKLIEIGLLEFDEDEYKVRSNKNFEILTIP